MTGAGQHGDTAYGDNAPEVVCRIGDDVPPEHRDAIRASVATMARRSAEASRRALDRSKANHELLTAMARPLRRLIDEDPDASAALASATRKVEAHRSQSRPEEAAWPAVRLVEGSQGTELDFRADRVFGSPWHYQWQWHLDRPPGHSSQDRETGRITISTAVDEDENLSNAHGGFGVALTSDRVQAAAGRSLRRTDHFYQCIAGGLGGVATVEGGMEMTAIEGGNVLSSALDKRFRRRVSNGEDDYVDFDGYTTGEGIEVNWVMMPGRTYTFNVGAWVFTEAWGGVGTSSFASASLRGLVIALTADFTD